MVHVINFVCVNSRKFANVVKVIKLFNLEFSYKLWSYIDFSCLVGTYVSILILGMQSWFVSDVIELSLFVVLNCFACNVIIQMNIYFILYLQMFQVSPKNWFVSKIQITYRLGLSSMVQNQTKRKKLDYKKTTVSRKGTSCKILFRQNNN